MDRFTYVGMGLVQHLENWVEKGRALLPSGTLGLALAIGGGLAALLLLFYALRIGCKCNTDGAIDTRVPPLDKRWENAKRDIAHAEEGLASLDGHGNKAAQEDLDWARRHAGQVQSHLDAGGKLSEVEAAVDSARFCADRALRELGSK